MAIVNLARPHSSGFGLGHRTRISPRGHRVVYRCAVWRRHHAGRRCAHHGVGRIKRVHRRALSHAGVTSLSIDGYIGGVVADTFNPQILGFTFALVGLVSVISRMGYPRSRQCLARFAKGPRSAQAVTSVMGTAVFFDDYANTVVVGTTARSLTDRYRISRKNWRISSIQPVPQSPELPSSQHGLGMRSASIV